MTSTWQRIRGFLAPYQAPLTYILLDEDQMPAILIETDEQAQSNDRDPIIGIAASGIPTAISALATQIDPDELTISPPLNAAGVRGLLRTLIDQEAASHVLWYTDAERLEIPVEEMLVLVEERMAEGAR